jgi:hypothetical protein
MGDEYVEEFPNPVLPVVNHPEIYHDGMSGQAKRFAIATQVL